MQVLPNFTLTSELERPLGLDAQDGPRIQFAQES
jgi:hypothetical protein